MRHIKIPRSAPIGQDNDGRNIWLSPEYTKLFDRQTGSAATEEAQTVAAGPSTHTMSFDRDGFVVVEGGTITEVRYYRRRTPPVTTTYQLGTSGGQYQYIAGDVMQVEYTSAPDITFFPA